MKICSRLVGRPRSNSMAATVDTAGVNRTDHRRALQRVTTGCIVALAFTFSFLGQVETPAQADERNAPTQILRRIRNSLGGIRTHTNERSHSSVKQAFQSVVRSARRSTVKVFCNDIQRALGTVVDSKGYVLTKASVLEGEIECLLSDRRRVTAKVVASDREHDLALLKLRVSNLIPVSWSTSRPTVGAWVVTAGISEQPAAIGVVSSFARRIAAPTAALGVGLEDTDDGPKISRVVPNSAAAKSRLRVHDVVLKVNDRQMRDSLTLSQTIQNYMPGEKVQLEVRRGTDRFSVTARLGDRSRLKGDNEQAEIMDSLGGPLSYRRSGFPVALQHDTVLRPRDCGGPLVDLDGRVVAINIARSSRVASYAIPAEAVRGLLSRMGAGILVRNSDTGLQSVSSAED